MSSRAATAAISSALTLAGCAAIPPVHLADVKPASAYRADQTFAAPTISWPGDEWWRAYDDAQLNQLIDEALAASPNVAEARARLDKADALAGVARANLFPTLQGQAQVDETKQSYNTGIPPAFVPHGWNSFGQTTLNFSWELDFWGKNRKALAAAVSDAKASDADLAEARLVLSTAIASAYADFYRLWAERDVAERAVKSREETLDLVRRRVDNGLDTRGELEEAKAGPANARSDLAAIDEDIALSRDRIAALMGQGPDRGLAIQRPSAPSLKAFGLPPRLPADLIGRRPDLAAARWRAEAAAGRIGVAKAQFYPDINLAAAIGFESLGISKLFLSGSSTGQVGPAITLPIFEGGRLRANLRGARADYETAVASYDETLTQALQDVADVAASERALSARVQHSTDALTADEDAYRIARLRYEGGLANYQSVLLVENAVLTDRRTVVDLKARAFTLDVQLIRALGGGYLTN
ncbi:MAG TPA: efflux transporter outer membrane subunit [Caulobacteraceae bacterium]